jgi:hypothetical protein
VSKEDIRGRVVARGKQGTKHEGKYVNLGTMWAWQDDCHQLSLENRAKGDDGRWDNYPVRVIATMPDGEEIEVTKEDFFVNVKLPEEAF